MALLLAFPLVGVAQHRVATVSTSVNADTIMIGDQVTFSVDIEKDISQDVGLPQFENNMMGEKLEIIGQPWVDTISVDGRSVHLRLNYTITSFDAGIYPLTGFPVIFPDGSEGLSGDTVRSASLDLLYVQTFEIDTTKMDIFDLKANMHTPFIMDELWDYIARNKEVFIAGAIFALLVAWGIYYWLQRRRRRLQVEKPKLPPHILALIALEELRSRHLWQDGFVREYYSDLSDILREYLDGRFGVGAMEMTTPEILSALVECCEKRELESSRGFFELADLVKFAKYKPSGEDCEESFVVVSRFVDQTKILVQLDDSLAEGANTEGAEAEAEAEGTEAEAVEASAEVSDSEVVTSVSDASRYDGSQRIDSGDGEPLK